MVSPALRSDSCDRASHSAADSDVENTAGNNNGAALDEQTPLLARDSDPPHDVGATKAVRRKVIGMCALFLFIVELSVYIVGPPMQQIMEDIICYQHYPDHILKIPSEQDRRCKGYEVQKTLAMVRSWALSLDMLIPMLVQIPYGIVADKYGRKPVLFLSLLGLVVNQTWCMVVLLFPNTFSIWAIMYGSIGFLIGGGGQMAVAMIWTMLADVVPVSERAAIFNQLYAMTLVLAIVVNPISAFLLTFDPWIAMWIGYFILVIGVFSVVFFPETLSMHKLADDKRQQEAQTTSSIGDEAPTNPKKGGLIKQTLFALRNDMSHMYRFIFASKSVMLLMLAYVMSFPVTLAFMVDLLQYLTRRFEWQWSTATYVSTIGNLTTVILLLGILPLASLFLTRRLGYDVLIRDLTLARFSIAVTVVGSLITAIASVPWLLVTGLIITSLGNGFGVQCRAMLNGIVDPHTLATLNTTISTLETFVGFLSAPALGWLLSRGLELGGLWMGLPYLVTTATAGLAMIAMLIYRVPTESTQASRI